MMSGVNALTNGETFDGTVYELAGPEDGSVVVLVHGLGMNRFTWESYVAPLSEDFRVLFYDLYGHGHSAAPTETPTLRTYSEQLHALLSHLELSPAAVVGFSLGGMINRRFAMDYPHAVSCLAILNSPHERGPEAQAAVEKRARDSAADGPSANIAATLERWFTSDFRKRNADEVERIKSWVVSNEAKTYADCRFVLANGVVELIRPEPPIEHPTIVLTCENDTGSTPDMAYAIGSEIPGSETVIVDELQHLGLIERPDLFLPILTGFLESNAR